MNQSLPQDTSRSQEDIRLRENEHSCDESFEKKEVDYSEKDLQDNDFMISTTIRNACEPKEEASSPRLVPLHLPSRPAKPTSDNSPRKIKALEIPTSKAKTAQPKEEASVSTTSPRLAPLPLPSRPAKATSENPLQEDLIQLSPRKIKSLKIPTSEAKTAHEY